MSKKEIIRDILDLFGLAVLFVYVVHFFTIFVTLTRGLGYVIVEPNRLISLIELLIAIYGICYVFYLLVKKFLEVQERG
jgi:hypothetical protein